MIFSCSGSRPVFCCHFSFLLVLTGLWLGSVHTADAETLRSALASAYLSNPTLSAERARLRATDEEHPRARSSMRPTITGTIDRTFTYTRTRPSARTDGRNASTGFAINLTQPIFRGFRTINAIRGADATIFAGREALRQVEQTTLLNAVTAYMDVVRDRAIVRHRVRNLEVLTQQLRATKDRLDAGEATKTDVAQARAARAAAQSQLALARANLDGSRARYQQVVGNRPLHPVAPRHLEGILPRSLTQALKVGLRDHPNIVQAEFLEKAAHYSVLTIRGELLPEFNLRAGYSKTFDPSRFTDQQDVGTIVGEVRVPLYQGGAVYARTRQAMETQAQRRREIDAARTQVRSEIVTAWAQHIAAKSSVVSTKAQVAANVIALSGVRAEQKEGQRSVLDVLRAERDLVNSKVTLEGAKRDQVVSAFTLLSAMGHLTAAELRLAVSYYDPRAHYEAVKHKWIGLGTRNRRYRRR